MKENEMAMTSSATQSIPTYNSNHNQKSTNENTNNVDMNIPFQILEVSSEDPKYPVCNLEKRTDAAGGGHNVSSSCNDVIESSSNSSTNNKNNAHDREDIRNDAKQGWQSKQNCTYPQYIVLKPICVPTTTSTTSRSDEINKQHHIIGSSNTQSDLHEGEMNTVRIHLTQMKILAHNQKIPSRLDVYVSDTCINVDHQENRILQSSSPYTSNSMHFLQKIKFQRLGYVVFDDNSKTNYRTRELKSISLDVKVTFIKLVIHTCHGYNMNSKDNTLDEGEEGRILNDVSSSLRHSNSLNVENQDIIINPFDQVGIVSIQLFGKCMMAEEDHTISSQKQHNKIEKSSAHYDVPNHGTGDEEDGKNAMKEEKIEKASIGINTTFGMEEKLVYSSKSSNSRGVKREGNRVNRRKKKSLNPNDIVDFKSRLASLEKRKLEKAASEDFHAAAKIKTIIVELNEMFSTFQKYQNEMSEAAENEDYMKASQLKSKRDKAYARTMDMLNAAEKKIEDLTSTLNEETSPSSSSLSINEFKTINTHLEDLSLSTIRRFDDDDPSVAMTMTGRSFQLGDEQQIVSGQTLSKQTKDEYTAVHEQHSDLKHQPIEPKRDFQENGEHPLEGVPDYLNLPTPEELHDGEGGLAISLNSSSSIVSTDSILKIESILGRYRTKCFLSKNWALREAALVKLTLILPAVIKKYKDGYPIEDDWLDSFLRSVCIILERAIDDKIVQVYLTGLILLDDCVCHIEKFQMSQKETISLLSNTILSLVQKMSSSNQKVVEGAETSLMSLAFFDGVGPTYIGLQLMKRASTKGKLLSSKFRLLRDIIDEFDDEAPNGQKIMEFVKKNGFGHKDADVREASKELTTAVFLRDGNIILSMLDGLSERQIKEYKLMFASAKQAVSQQKILSRETKQTINTLESTNAEINKLLAPTPNDAKQLVAQTPRGRGRGRGRRVASQGDRLGRISHPSKSRMSSKD